jgi:signal transduction histidine kinase
MDTLSVSRGIGAARAARSPSRPAATDASSVHDLPHVLSCVLGYAQLLLSMTDDEKMLEYLGVIDASSRRCHELTGRMLMPTHSANMPDARDSDVRLVAKEVCELVRGEAILGGVTLVMRIDDALPSAAMPEEDLRRVLLDLLRNAISATPRGGRVEVNARECRLGARTRGVKIEVADTGRGIPEYSRSMIFSPFFSTAGPGDGTGLGLAIARSLVERANGSIDVKTAEAGGATFGVRLPAAARTARVCRGSNA